MIPIPVDAIVAKYTKAASDLSLKLKIPLETARERVAQFKGFDNWEDLIIEYTEKFPRTINISRIDLLYFIDAIGDLDAAKLIDPDFCMLKYVASKITSEGRLRRRQFLSAIANNEEKAVYSNGDPLETTLKHIKALSEDQMGALLHIGLEAISLELSNKYDREVVEVLKGHYIG